MSPRCVVFEQLVIGEAFCDCFASSIVCSLSVTPYGRRDIRQGVSCEKEVLNYLRNAVTRR